MTKHKTLLILIAVVLITQVVFGIVIALSFDSWTDRGTFGDMFGAVNTLFSGLAFAGVIYTILMQSSELKLQREALELQRNELELTRTELSKSANAQQEQSGLMLHTAKINAASTKLNAETLLVVNNKSIPGAPHQENSMNTLQRTFREFKELVESDV